MSGAGGGLLATTERPGESRLSEDPLAAPAASPPSPPGSLHERTETNTNIAQVYRLLLDDDHDESEHHDGAFFATRPTARQENNDDDDRREKQQQQEQQEVYLLGPVANLCSATLGAGILALPYAIWQAGLLAGCLLLVLAACATVASIGLLVQACQYYQLFTYEALVQHCFGRQWSRLVQLCIVVFCEGCAVAYVIAVADILQTSHVMLIQNSKVLSTIVVWSVAMLPLSCLPTMQSLQWASTVGMASIGTLVFCAFVHWIDDLNNNSQSHDTSTNHTNTTTSIFETVMSFDINDNYIYNYNYNNNGTTNNTTATSFASFLWPANNSVLSVWTACPIVLFAFSCQVNVCAIYHELPSPTPSTTTNNLSDRAMDEEDDDDDENVSLNHHHSNDNDNNNDDKQQLMSKVTRMAVMSCALLYASLSGLALADLGNNVTPNVLVAYEASYTPLVQVACAAVAAAVVMAFPLNIFPARVTLQHLLFPPKTTTTTTTTTTAAERLEQRATANENLTAALLEDYYYDGDGDNNNNDNKEESPSRQEQDVSASRSATDPRENLQVEDGEPESDDDDDDESDTVSWFSSVSQHVVLTLVLAGSALGLALIVPDISVVFGLLGGTTSSVLGFCVPGALGIRMSKDTGDRSFLAISWLLLVGGIIVGVLTTVVTVYSTLS